MKVSSNYVGAYYNRWNEEVLVWERDSQVEGSPRTLKRYKAPYYFYVNAEDGNCKSIFGDRLKKLEFSTRDAFEKKLSFYKNIGSKIYESDIRPMEKILMANYYEKEAPPIHYTLCDIEVDYSSDLGFASPENPYAEINAITLFHQWSKKYVTIAIPPKSWDSDWEKLLDQSLKSLTDLRLVRTEKELLQQTLQEIEDCDIFSGWNSEFFDLPYLLKRTEIVLGEKDFKKWSFKGANSPRFDEVNRFGELRIVAKISGRAHLDYLQLFKKFAFGGRPSYALRAIADDELDIPKLEYEGSLENLYNTNFNWFLRYNIRDVEILEKLDNKFKYIDIANELSHENTVIFEAVLGTVKQTDTGLINYCHYKKNQIIPDKIPTIGPKIEGALVLDVKVGLHEWIGSVDINSLYPSAIRSLNISPEKLIGQFSKSNNPMLMDGEADWEGIKNKDKNLHTLYHVDGSEITATGEEWSMVLKAKKWAVSGFGTVFDQNEQGFIPAVLEFWYTERKKLQKLKVEWGDKARAAEKGSIEYKEAKEQEEFYDKKQMIKKLSLNSLYGALINEGDKFYDFRLGASTTGTGRKITGHMISKICELLTGEYANLEKYKGELKKTKDGTEQYEHRYKTDSKVALASDTDSCYFTTLASNKEEAIAVADAIADAVNESFIPFMQEAFLCNPGYDNIIKAGREVVADRGIFQAKKKYVLHIVNLDGKPIAPDDKKSLKVMGGEIKKSDTPKAIQDVLKQVTLKILVDKASYEELCDFVNLKRKEFRGDEDVIKIGVSKSVNTLEKYAADFEIEKRGGKKARLPGHVRAAINYNEHLKLVGDLFSPAIKAGDKVKTFYLKRNDYRYDSIAIPSDLVTLPKWFDELSVDLKKTEEKMFDLKLESIFEPCGWIVPTTQQALNNKLIEW